MTPLSEDEIAAITEREAKATAGPWWAMCEGNQYVDNQSRLVAASRVEGIKRPWNARFVVPPEKLEEVARFTDEDADFIAHARTDIPRLVHDWRAQKAELERRRTQQIIAIEREDAQKATIEALTAERDAAVHMRDKFNLECDGLLDRKDQMQLRAEKAEAERDTWRWADETHSRALLEHVKNAEEMRSEVETLRNTLAEADAVIAEYDARPDWSVLPIEDFRRCKLDAIKRHRSRLTAAPETEKP